MPIAMAAFLKPQYIAGGLVVYGTGVAGAMVFFGPDGNNRSSCPHALLRHAGCVSEKWLQRVRV